MEDLLQLINNLTLEEIFQQSTVWVSGMFFVLRSWGVHATYIYHKMHVQDVLNTATKLITCSDTPHKSHEWLTVTFLFNTE